MTIALPVKVGFVGIPIVTAPVLADTSISFAVPATVAT